MKKLKQKFETLAHIEINWLIAIFFASMLGAVGSGLVQRLGAELTSEAGMGVSFVISLLATVVYSAAVAGTLYLIVPESRPAFKRLWKNMTH